MSRQRAHPNQLAMGVVVDRVRPRAEDAYKVLHRSSWVAAGIAVNDEIGGDWGVVRHNTNGRWEQLVVVDELHLANEYRSGIILDRYRRVGVVPLPRMRGL